MPAYPASFMDKFMDLIARLPSPYWLTYLLLFLLQGLLLHAVAWIAGWLPAGTFAPATAVFPLWLWGPMAIMTYLNSVSLAALSSFRPLLDVDEQELRRLRYEFRYMPARSVIVSSVLWVVVYLLLAHFAFGAIYAVYGYPPNFQLFITLEGVVSFATGSAIYYHSVRQLRLVNQTVRMAPHFNMFRLDPVYAFSRVTSQTGIAWVILLTSTLLLFPVALTNAMALSILALQVLLAIAAFALPLWFVHRRLAAEKNKLVSEHNRRVESTLERLHGRLAQKELEGMDQLNSAITALNSEAAVLAGIPTWPWRSGTLRGFVSAIVLPIMLFLVQLGVRKWLGG